MKKYQLFSEFNDKEVYGDNLEGGEQIGIDARLINNIQLAAATLGRKGGSVKSEKKAASSRENGKKGGRPRKGPVI